MGIFGEIFGFIVNVSFYIGPVFYPLISVLLFVRCLLKYKNTPEREGSEKESRKIKMILSACVAAFFVLNLIPLFTGGAVSIYIK